MAKLVTSGRSTDPKVPYQRPVYGHTVIKPPDEEAVEAARWRFRARPLELRLPAHLPR